MNGERGTNGGERCVVGDLRVVRGLLGVRGLPGACLPGVRVVRDVRADQVLRAYGPYRRRGTLAPARRAGPRERRQRRDM
ncbi:hypothetical protein NKH77_26600 [Streptomyces sp. M19]